MSRNLKIKWKKKISVLLLTAMFAGCGIFSPQLRADATEETSSSVTKEYISDISQYRQTGGYTCPSKDGYVFGGWYSDETLNTPLATTQTTGGAYAKYVPADVLSVKFQSTMAGTITNDKDIRLITTVDSLNYSAVGFSVKNLSHQNQPFEKASSTVYTTIKGNGDTYTPDVFHQSSKFFMTICFTGITADKFEQQLYVEPYWITLDGTKVIGNTRRSKIWDIINNNSNVVLNFHQNVTFLVAGDAKSTGAWVEEVAGEKGCIKLTSSSEWPQMRFNSQHTVASYQDAGYQYIVFRMYFPEEEDTWTSLTFGSAASGGTRVSAGKIVKGEWKDYYFPAKTFYDNWSGTECKDVNYVKLYSGESAKGAVAYLSEIRMEKTTNLIANYNGWSDSNSFCYAAISGGTISNIAEGFENEKPVMKFTLTSNTPRFRFSRGNGPKYEDYEAAGYKYIVFRMYFPENESNVSAIKIQIVNDSNAILQNSDTSITVEKGKWKDYYFPASYFYGAKDSGKNTGIDFGSLKDVNGNTVSSGVAYLSEIRMEYTKPNN